MLALGAKGWDMGVLVRGGTGAGCFPFDTGGVGSELAWMGQGHILACIARLVGLLIVWSFWIAKLTVIFILSNISSTWVVLLSVGDSGVSKALVLWIWTVQLLRYTQQYQAGENLTSFPWYCPVPLRGCRLLMYSLSRNLAISTSLATVLFIQISPRVCRSYTPKNRVP